jgi:hypothetical protein
MRIRELIMRTGFEQQVAGFTGADHGFVRLERASDESVDEFRFRARAHALALAASELTFGDLETTGPSGIHYFAGV